MQPLEWSRDTLQSLNSTMTDSQNGICASPRIWATVMQLLAGTFWSSSKWAFGSGLPGPHSSVGRSQSAAQRQEVCMRRKLPHAGRSSQQVEGTAVVKCKKFNLEHRCSDHKDFDEVQKQQLSFLPCKCKCLLEEPLGVGEWKSAGVKTVLEESKCHGASEHPGKTLRTKSTRTNTSSGTE